MLEQVDLDRSLSKEESDRRMRALRLKVFAVGHAVYESQTPVVVVFEGRGASGKGTTISALTSRLDPRGFRVHAITGPVPNETRYPWLYRFWLKTPARGEMSIFHGSWYRRVLLDRVEGEVSKKQLAQAFRDIREFERMLADDGVVLLKFWLEISKKEQKRRIEKLLKRKRTAWQVSEEERVQQKQHAEYTQAVEEMFGQTEAEYAPWNIVAATDRGWTDVQVLETLISRLEPHIAAQEVPLPPEIEQTLEAIGREDGVVLTSAVSKMVAPANPEAEEGKANA